MTAAIILWNTVYLERATNALRNHGDPWDDTLLQYLSPLGWEHINMTGDYLWRRSIKVGKGYAALPLMKPFLPCKISRYIKNQAATVSLFKVITIEG